MINFDARLALDGTAVHIWFELELNSINQVDEVDQIGGTVCGGWNANFPARRFPASFWIDFRFPQIIHRYSAQKAQNIFVFAHFLELCSETLIGRMKSTEPDENFGVFFVFFLPFRRKWTLSVHWTTTVISTSQKYQFNIN